MNEKIQYQSIDGWNFAETRKDDIVTNVTIYQHIDVLEIKRKICRNDPGLTVPYMVNPVKFVSSMTPLHTFPTYLYGTDFKKYLEDDTTDDLPLWHHALDTHATAVKYNHVWEYNDNIYFVLILE